MAQKRSNSWLKPLLKPLYPAFREVALMSLFVNILALAPPVFIYQVYDRVVFYQGLATLYALVAGVAIAIGFDFIMRQARARLLQRAAVHIDARLGARLFDKLASLPLAVLEGRPLNYWNILFRDIDTVRNVFCGSTAITAVDLPFVFLFVALIFAIATPVAWVIVAAIPLFLLLAWRSGRVIERATADERESGNARDALTAELLAARTTVKALALKEGFKQRWEGLHANGIENAYHRGAKGDGYTNLGVMLTALTTISLTATGAIAIIDQRLSIGALIATVMLSSRILAPINQAIGAWRQFAHYKQAVERLGEIFEQASERRESDIELGRPSGEIMIENIHFAYDGQGAPVIDGIRVQIKPGGMVGIVGNNGSGKTTLLKLIQGLYTPSEGRVLLDGAVIGQFTRRELAGWIGYVPQESVLFSLSVRDNISIGHPDATDEEIVAAARRAGVHDYVIDLPDGYATNVGESGSRLSGGERQRIAIARALVKDPPVLLLDEVASNLNQSAQDLLCETLTALAPDHTIVIVSHAPSMLAACSHILVLDHGKIRAAGPAGEMLAKLAGTASPATPVEVKA